MFKNKKKAKELEEIAQATIEQDAKEYTEVFIERVKLDGQWSYLDKKMNERFYANEDNSKRFEENVDYEEIEDNYEHLILFYNKDIQPYRFIKNDYYKEYFVRLIESGTVITRIRQQRTQGSLNGSNSFHFEHHGRSSEGNGGGRINGDLDTKDEFILVVNFDNKYRELRVSANLFYRFKENDKIFITYNDIYHQYSRNQKVEYNQKELIEAEGNRMNKAEVNAKIKVISERMAELQEKLPPKKLEESIDKAKDILYGPLRPRDF